MNVWGKKKYVHEKYYEKDLELWTDSAQNVKRVNSKSTNSPHFQQSLDCFLLSLHSKSKTKTSVKHEVPLPSSGKRLLQRGERSDSDWEGHCFNHDNKEHVFLPPSHQVYFRLLLWSETWFHNCTAWVFTVSSHSVSLLVFYVCKWIKDESILQRRAVHTVSSSRQNSFKGPMKWLWRFKPSALETGCYGYGLKIGRDSIKAVLIVAGIIIFFVLIILI